MLQDLLDGNIVLLPTLLRSTRLRVHIFSPDLTIILKDYRQLGEFELIRLYEQTFAIHPDAVLVRFLTGYDFLESHKIEALRAFDLARERKAAKRIFREARKAGLP